ncbi:MAG: hypothetical protein ACRBCJ_07500 [Hyphomicrobiaceae bacterium]
MWKFRNRVAKQAQEDALNQVQHGGAGRHAGRSATLLSAFALLFSGYSFYESVLRAPLLEIYVPPRIAYTDPDRPDSPFEVFIVPLTLANDGARSGTILSIDLEVTNPRTRKTKKFYSARLGPWGIQPIQAYAPISLAGRGSVSHAVQFFPRENETIPRIMDLEAGNYEFHLTLNATKTGRSYGPFAAKTKSLKFEMKSGNLDYRNFTQTGTMPMWSADYRPATTSDKPTGDDQ